MGLLEVGTTLSAIFPACVRRAHDTGTNFLPNTDLVGKQKPSKHFEVTGLVFPGPGLLISHANGYFTRSMPKSKFLNPVCIFVNRDKPTEHV